MKSPATRLTPESAGMVGLLLIMLLCAGMPSVNAGGTLSWSKCIKDALTMDSPENKPINYESHLKPCLAGMPRCEQAPRLLLMKTVLKYTRRDAKQQQAASRRLFEELFAMCPPSDSDKSFVFDVVATSSNGDRTAMFETAIEFLMHAVREARLNPALERKAFIQAWYAVSDPGKRAAELGIVAPLNTERDDVLSAAPLMLYKIPGKDIKEAVRGYIKIARDEATLATSLSLSGLDLKGIPQKRAGTAPEAYNKYAGDVRELVRGLSSEGKIVNTFYREFYKMLKGEGLFPHSPKCDDLADGIGTDFVVEGVQMWPGFVDFYNLLGCLFNEPKGEGPFVFDRVIANGDGRWRMVLERVLKKASLDPSRNYAPYLSRFVNYARLPAQFDAIQCVPGKLQHFTCGYDKAARSLLGSKVCQHDEILTIISWFNTILDQHQLDGRDIDYRQRAHLNRLYGDFDSYLSAHPQATERALKAKYTLRVLEGKSINGMTPCRSELTLLESALESGLPDLAVLLAKRGALIPTYAPRLQSDLRLAIKIWLRDGLANALQDGMTRNMCQLYLDNGASLLSKVKGVPMLFLAGTVERTRWVLEEARDRGEGSLVYERIDFEHDREVTDYWTRKSLRAALEDRDGRTLLMEAVAAGDVGMFDLLIEFNSGSSFVQLKDPHERTLMHLAALYNRASFVAKLVGLDVPLDVTDKDGKTPLVIAVERNLVGMVRSLLNAWRKDVRESDWAKQLSDLLLRACKAHSLDMVNLLVEYGASFDGHGAIAAVYVIDEFPNLSPALASRIISLIRVVDDSFMPSTVKELIASISNKNSSRNRMSNGHVAAPAEPSSPEPNPLSYKPMQTIPVEPIGVGLRDHELVLKEVMDRIPSQDLNI